MILLLSRRSGDATTDVVSNWLGRLGAQFFRLNAEDLAAPTRFSYAPLQRRLCLDDVELDLTKVRVVWYRRWASADRYHGDDVDRFFDDPHRQYELMRYLTLELGAVGQALFSGLRHAWWLGDPASAQIDKNHVLSVAAEVGLDVPDTLIATTRTAMRAFAARHRGVITKSLTGRAYRASLSASAASSYTVEVDDALLEAGPEVGFPSLLQEQIAKRYEIRSFVLGDTVRSMAIFSQSDQQTSVDFRRYNDERPNRCVPYQLPAAVQDRLLAMMRRLGLRTGSADLIRAVDGRHVFLEVNPIGQFGMVSGPCNYHLEREVAAYLMEHDHDR